MKRLTRIFFKILTFTVIVSIISSFLAVSEVQSQENFGLLRAGIAKIDITPDKPVKLYGYRSRKTLSEGVHDSLYARAVVFENDGKKVVLVSSDLGSYSRETFTYIQKSILDKFKLEKSELFLSAIHSHSAPSLTINKERGHPNNLEYTEEVKQKLITVIGEAFNNLIPVHTGMGVGYSPVGANRREMKPDGSISLGRNPYGPTDKEVLLMKIAKPDGTPIGALFDYATHATSLGPRNMQVSGDVLGISAQFVEKILGKEVISPVFAGASGNIDPWYRVLPGFNTEPGRIPEPVLLGTLLGEEVVHVFRDIKEVNPGGEINTSFATLECPRRKMEDDREPDRKTVPVNITAARVGDAAFIGISVEMLTQIGMAIKSGSPYKHTFVITHCNGASGYLAPKELYKEGGYEVRSSRFEIQSADMVLKKALRMLYDL